MTLADRMISRIGKEGCLCIEGDGTCGIHGDECRECYKEEK